MLKTGPIKKLLQSIPIKNIFVGLVLIVLATILLMAKIKPAPSTQSPKVIAQNYDDISKTTAVPPSSSQKEASSSAQNASSSASSKPTFEETNALFGPCTHTPTLMYHHIQDLSEAKSQGHQSLTVSPQFLRSQMEYLKSRNYTVISMQDLVDFFNNAKPLPPKSILLTFDDGYDDFGLNAAPVLSQLNLKATLFSSYRPGTKSRISYLGYH